MFDFPASPTVGQASNGYTWNGTMWTGGPGVSGPQTEQLLTLDGLTQYDVQVPTWAKGVQIVGSCYTTAVSNQALMRVSADGTTFFAGAADYAGSGAYHNTVVTNYNTSAPFVTSNLALGPSGDQGAVVAHTFSAEMNLVRASTGQVFTFKTYAKQADAALGHRTWWGWGWPQTSTTTALAIKALRFLPLTGAFGPNSWIKVKWLGDSAAIPQSNAISDAPSDGGEYVRVNGVWRETSRTFDLSGKTNQDVTVPTWAKSVEIESQLFITASEFLTLRMSFDGSTFAAGAVDYANAAALHMAAGGASAYQTYTETATNALILSGGGGYINLPHQTTTVLNLTRPTTSHLFAMRSYGKSYNIAAGENYRTGWWGGYFAGTTAALAIKAIRFLGGSGTTFGSSSFIRVKWIG